jgi:hypothetical protein
MATCLISLGAYIVPKADAGDWDEKSILTFDQPVELPGIVLPAGAYIFKLIESPADRNIVRVLSADEHTVLATINAIPKLRYEAPENTLIVYEDRPAGSPRALKEWFYPDRRVGHEFVYPKSELSRLARTDVTMSDNSEGNSAPAAVTDESSYMQLIQQRQSGESDAAASNFEPGMPTEQSDYMQLLKEKQSEPLMLARVDEPEKTHNSNDMAELQSHPAAHEMPRTGSLMPLVGLSGMLLIGTGVSLRLCSRQAS